MFTGCIQVEKDKIRLKDFRALHVIVIIAILGLWCFAAINLNASPPRYWWALGDIVIGLFNCVTLYLSLSAGRDVRIAEENLLKAMKDGKSGM